MYLKSIEAHGFKSFANKIALEFHNGITGIVGPNGSGKSNVSDAVRWVLGEQSAKQLRGASMQDVIFSGTENRKPLSYAYVAITMDNSDRMLDIDYQEVTVARRVYRSGESEYLLNGSPCRLKDVNELFYDTGIGKEGYSIIGQGQIEKILSGRPEEKRELFDEAAGIVKYKRRKAAAQKKLETERENLIRIQDILSELERQTGPLEKQSEKAKVYLKTKEELKKCDVNLFLLDIERIKEERAKTEASFKIADEELRQTAEDFEKVKGEYEKTELALEQIEAEIEKDREKLNETALQKGKRQGEINVLKEQIKSDEQSDGHYKSRKEEIEKEKQEKLIQKQEFEKEQEHLGRQLGEAASRCQLAKEQKDKLKEAIERYNGAIEESQKELLSLLNQKASLQAKQEKFNAMAEQVNIRKAQLTKRLLEQRSQESGLKDVYEEQTKALAGVKAAITQLKGQETQILAKQEEWERKRVDLKKKTEEDTAAYHKITARLESLKNLAERYDGYGGSIRKVMAKRDAEPNILGVVSDLIKVEKRYETAIETALGGSIQNIVTEDDETAKRMIAYLKQNRYGRATFLPLTSIKGKGGISNPEALKETGVIGLAHTLVTHDPKYAKIAAQLLGRVVVADTIDHAIALAKKYRHTLSIVTLEGESLRPGGSMTGGAFKNSSNLLGRNREIEDLSMQKQQIRSRLDEYRMQRGDLHREQSLLSDEIEEVREKLQEQYLLENTAELNAKRARQQKEESEEIWKGLQSESRELDRQIQEMKEESETVCQELNYAKRREEELSEESRLWQEKLDGQLTLEAGVNESLSHAQMEEANLKQRNEFAVSNLMRVTDEIEKCGIQEKQLTLEAARAKQSAGEKKQEIEEIQKAIEASELAARQLESGLKEKTGKKEALMADRKGFFAKREEISGRMADLDKEIFRLTSRKEKLDEAREQQTNYMWEEYELTPHAAVLLRDETCQDLSKLKNRITSLKDEIRALGDVNVNAIEEYKEVSERYGFMKGQHDDLTEAEAALVGIIEELDEGMRRQFSLKFQEIQKEFDRAFKELFGGGKGTLELVEEEDILECGIRIIAQPPGKKLQNMILLSGGEKSLTAIALLFAIQNLKPSPFCLLDEIEAALDDSNVGRFAKYLHKLTKNTQFIVITHRRGTMASADRLYGITMQEKGVSTLVSVDLIEHDLEK